ncbi:glycosyltransferase family 2 protein [Microbacterium sp. LMI1-1-1.1]|uniref:glycosyltransferase family 2 protein n=1 Tax=Microbacterium sp. LMI1-1-1.1 TaxID=3135223 RepID=UPI0034650DE2
MTNEAVRPLPITVLVQTKNEAVGIGKCLQALSDFSEVIVVDSLSTDDTASIARRSGAKVVDFDWNGKYPKKKQWQLENVPTANEWVLFIDADETPQAGLVKELRNIFAGSPEPGIVAFDIGLDYVFAGRVLRHGHRVTKRCLVRKGFVRFPVMDDLTAPGMGELEGHYQPEADGAVLRLTHRILHNDLDPVSSWFARHNKYSDWEAHLRSRRDVQADVRRRRSRQGRIFDAVPFKPLVFFVYAYILRAGFRDGRAGFDYAVALATYYWQIGLKTRELRRNRVTQ